MRTIKKVTKMPPNTAAGSAAQYSRVLTVADGRDAHASALAAQHVEQRDDEAGAAGAEGMPEGHGTAKNVDPVRRRAAATAAAAEE